MTTMGAESDDANADSGNGNAVVGTGVTVEQMEAARARLRERMAGGQMGGKGTARRKTKKAHRSNDAEEKKLQGVLKRLTMNTVPNIEEVQIIMNDGNMLQFNRPKVQTKNHSKLYVVSGHPEVRPFPINCHFPIPDMDTEETSPTIGKLISDKLKNATDSKLLSKMAKSSERFGKHIPPKTNVGDDVSQYPLEDHTCDTDVNDRKLAAGEYTKYESHKKLVYTSPNSIGCPASTSVNVSNCLQTSSSRRMKFVADNSTHIDPTDGVYELVENFEEIADL